MEKKKKTSLEERIEQFCTSSGELMAEINSKYKKDDKQKRKKKKKNIILMPDPDHDIHDDELFEGRL
jgi:hypothetical protein